MRILLMRFRTRVSKHVLYMVSLLFMIMLIVRQPFVYYRIKINPIRILTLYDRLDATNSKNILLTGGLGTIGKSLCASLVQKDYNVIILDVGNNTHELFTELRYQNISKDRVVIFHGDIRDFSVLHTIKLKYKTLHGVIHLAAVSQEHWCAEHLQDCFKINVEGTQMLLEIIKSLFSIDNTKPWLLYLSSYLVYGKQFSSAYIDENSAMRPNSAYAHTKIEAEHIISKFSHAFSRVTILRISDAYGSFYDYFERSIPYLVRQALTNNPISLPADNTFRNYVHIVDVVRVCLSLLQEVNLNGTIDEKSKANIFLLTGHTMNYQELLRTIINITNSQALLRIPDGIRNNRYKRMYSNKKIYEQLNYTLLYPTIEQGLQKYINDILKRELFIVKDIFDMECSQKTQQEINLDNCSMAIYTNLIPLTALTCSSNGLLTTNNHFSSHFRFISSKMKSFNGMSSYYIQCPNASLRFLTFVNKTLTTLNVGTPFYVSYFPENRSVALLIRQDSWSKDVFSLQLDGTLQLWNNMSHPFFLSPYCCEGKSSLPLLKVDPILEKRQELSWQTINGTLKSKCSRLKTFIIEEELRIAQNVSSKKLFIKKQPVKKRKLWSDVLAPDKRLCDSHCSLYTGCVRLRDCHCVFGRCGGKHLFPYHNLPYSKFSNSSILQRTLAIKDWKMDNISFEQTLKFHSRVFFQSFKMPRIHVLDVPSKFIPHYNDKRRHEIQREHCFIADNVILTEFKKISTNLGTAQFVIIPFFHGFYFHYGYMNYFRLLDVLKQLHAFAIKNLLQANSSAKLIFILTHDFGGCVRFVWDQIDLLIKSRNYQLSILHDAYLLQTSGDYNTNCYYPNKDVVIPPLTCLTPSLVSTFRDVRNIKNVLDRRVFMFFKGRVWGSGAATRARLSCPNLMKRTNNNGSSISLIQKYYSNSDYLKTLNETKFCLQVPGIAGWSPRFVDSVYAGCIPVFLSTYTHYPFEDIIDYDTFSIHISENDLDTLEEKLMQYTDDELILKQKHLLLVREAFIFKDYQNQLEELKNRNDPLFFILLSLQMRLKLQSVQFSRYMEKIQT